MSELKTGTLKNLNDLIVPGNATIHADGRTGVVVSLMGDKVINGVSKDTVTARVHIKHQNGESFNTYRYDGRSHNDASMDIVSVSQPKREPQPGEVWEFSDGPYVITQAHHGVSATRLDGNQFHNSEYQYEDGVRGTRVAPSLEAYYEKKIARKLLESFNSEGVAATVQIIRFTAEDPIN